MSADHEQVFGILKCCTWDVIMQYMEFIADFIMLYLGFYNDVQGIL